jgi:hypothetical protein
MGATYPDLFADPVGTPLDTELPNGTSPPRDKYDGIQNTNSPSDTRLLVLRLFHRPEMMLRRWQNGKSTRRRTFTF